MIKIRLMRIGSKKRPFYRIVAVDERKKRTGGYLDLLGTYNPLTNPKEVNIDNKKVEEWVKKGAVMSDGFLRVIGKAPQRPPRKPKKAQPEPAAPASAPVTDESAASEETSAESAETPSEETTQVETPAENASEETAETTQESEVKEESATPDEPESDKAEAIEEGSK